LIIGVFRLIGRKSNKNEAALAAPLSASAFGDDRSKALEWNLLFGDVLRILLDWGSLVSLSKICQGDDLFGVILAHDDDDIGGEGVGSGLVASYRD
jgi:hypothetical protein